MLYRERAISKKMNIDVLYSYVFKFHDDKIDILALML